MDLQLQPSLMSCLVTGLGQHGHGQKPLKPLAAINLSSPEGVRVWYFCSHDRKLPDTLGIGSKILFKDKIPNDS